MYKLHIIATWMHILSAVYWLGAIFFTLTVLGPTMRKQSGKVALPIMFAIQGRVRSFVLVAIVIFVATGLFNSYYRGLWDNGLDSAYGRIFMIKMIPVAIMFTIYFSAPLILKKLSPAGPGICCEIEQGVPHSKGFNLSEGLNHHSDGNKNVGKVFAILHVIALGCGVTVVFLGVMLRG